MSSANKNNRANTHKKIKVILLSSVIGVLIIAVMLMITAFMMTKIDFPQKLVYPIAILCNIVGLFCSGFICAKILKSDGLVNGLLCGIIIYVVSFLCEIALFRRGLSIVDLYKLIIYLVTSMIGGTVAVNFNKRALKTKKYK